MLTKNCGFSEGGNKLNPITGNRLKDPRKTVPAITNVATGFRSAFSNSGA